MWYDSGANKLWISWNVIFENKCFFQSSTSHDSSLVLLSNFDDVSSSTTWFKSIIVYQDVVCLILW